MTTFDFLRCQIIPLAYRQLPAGELMLRAAAGDPEAFIVLMGWKYPAVEAVCRSLLGRNGPVEDIATEVFLQLWRQREKIRSADAIDGWLTQTARNLALKSIAAEAKGREAGREWWQRHQDAAGTDQPVRVASQAELARRVRQAIAELPAPDRRVLEAADAAEGDQQAAGDVGLPIGTYRVRLHRARQRLLAALKRCGVAPVVGAVALVGGLKARAGSVVAALWATTAGKVKLACLALVLIAGLIGGVRWATATPDHVPPADPAPPALAANAETPQQREQKRMDRVFAPVITEIENGLKQIAFGNQAGARLREMRYDTKRPAALFDWWHKHEQDGKVLFEKRSVVEVGYDANGDCLAVWYYPDGLGGPKRHVDPQNPIIPFISPEWGIQWSLRLPWFKRGAALMEDVRAAYVIDKDRVDEAASSVIAKLEAILARMARGNEGGAHLKRQTYVVNRPSFLFMWRHREVKNGRVVFDRELELDIVYLAETNQVMILFGQVKLGGAPWHWLTPDSNCPINPSSPVSDANPRIPAELLREVPEILEPIVRLYRHLDTRHLEPGADRSSPPPIVSPK